jgi:hypothetical protein
VEADDAIPMIRIAINVAAFDAVASTLPVGSVMYEAETNAKGERMIWLEPRSSTGSTHCTGPARAVAM